MPWNSGIAAYCTPTYGTGCTVGLFGSAASIDANVSLARARAESVKNALIEKCSTTNGCAMKDDQVVVLVSGPLHTPTRELSPPATQRDGFPEDRRVDVWVIWTRKPADAARR